MKEAAAATNLLSEIVPKTIEHMALVDFLEREGRRLIIDRGGRADRAFDECLQRIQRRMRLPQYEGVYQRLVLENQFESIESNRIAIEALVKQARELKLFPEKGVSLRDYFQSI